MFNIRLRSIDLEAARTELNILPAPNPPQLPRPSPWPFRTTFELPKMPVPAFFAGRRHLKDEAPSHKSLDSMVALLDDRRLATNYGGAVPKMSGFRETVRSSRWSLEDLSDTQAGVHHPKFSNATFQDNMAYARISPFESKYPASLAAAYVPKRGAARMYHGSCKLFCFRQLEM